MRIRSLTARFVLTLLLSTAVPFLAFGWFVRGGMTERLEHQVVRVLLTDQAEAVAAELDRLTDRVYRNCWLIKAAAERLLHDGDGAAFEAGLDLMPGFHSDFQAVLVAGVDGQVQVAVHTLGLDTQRRTGSRPPQPSSVRQADWFQATVGEDLGMFWVDRHLSPLLHRNPERLSLDPLDYSLGIAFQVAGDGSERGVAYALVSWKRVQDVIDEVRDRLRVDAGFASAAVSVCDGRGVVLASSDRRRYSSQLAPQALAAGALAAFESTAIVGSDGGTGAQLAAIGRVGEGAARAFDWRCIVDVPSRELFATPREFGELIVAVTVLTAVVLVIWSWLASRAILRPVRGLAQATAKIAGGDLTTRVPIRGRDELAELGRSFNAMTSQLADSQARLRDAAREAAWAEMARQVAHEIKNPLTPMRLSAQMLQRARASGDPRVPEIVDRLARTVLEQTDQLARIASDFRQFSGRAEPRSERIEADDLLRDVDALFAAVRDEQHELSIHFGAAGAQILGDRGELRRVLVNLVQNALEAIGAAGRIEVRSRRAADGGVEISVRDDGPGIPPEVAARLFEPYFTTRSSGTGLGLAICRRIVEAHGGRIASIGTTAGATEFRCWLPTVQPPSADAAS